MSKKVIKSSNKNEKYNLKSVLDTDNIISGVSLKTVTAIGCASIIASCDNKNNDDNKGNEDKTKLKWDDFKDYQSKFKNGKEDFDKFVSECKKKGISEDDITKMIENLDKQDVQNVLDGKEIKEENGKITIDGKAIDLTKTKPETDNTFSNFNNLSKEQKATLEAYGITDKNTLDEFLNIKDNEEFKNKKISELFNEKDIKDDNLRNKLEAYKNSKQPSTPQVSEEKIKKLKDLIQYKDDDYTIYNFYDNNIKTEEINKIYEKIKEGNLTPEDKDVSKNNSLAKNLKDIIENKNNIKDVRLAIFKKIVEKLSKDKEYFEFSSDNKKQFQINIKFTFKDEKGANKTETELKTYKPEDINIQEKIDIETHQIYTELSSLKEISKSSIDEAFNLENAKKDGKDIADGAGETKDLNAYLAVLKNNFDKLKDLNNISNDAIKTKIHGQLLKNIQAKLTDFVDKKLAQTEKGSDIAVPQIVTAMKSTGICKNDNAVIDEASMKSAPNNSDFFLKDIIGAGGFLNAKYQAMITAMFKHFHDTYDNDNVGDFKKKIDELKSTDFTDNDANTKLKINNGESTYFEKKTVSTPSGWDKFKNVINQINAIGEVKMDANKLNDGKTLADAANLGKINDAFKAIHDVRTELDKITDPILKGSKLYEFLEDIVGKEENQVEYPKYSVYNSIVGSPMPETGLTTTLKNVTGGLLPLAIMTKATNFKTLGTTEMGNILKVDCTGEFQASILKYVNLCLPNGQVISKSNIAHNVANNDYTIVSVSAKYDGSDPVVCNWGCTNTASNGTKTSFCQQLVRVQDEIKTDKDKFLEYIRAIKIINEIKYTGFKNTGAAGSAIYVEDFVTASNVNKLHTALLKQNSDFKQILPFLGKIELVIDVFVKHDEATNDANNAAGVGQAFALHGNGGKKINLSVSIVIPYNINRNRLYINSNDALKDIKGNDVANTDYTYGMLREA